jgi:hypothetical protein
LWADHCPIGRARAGIVAVNEAVAATSIPMENEQFVSK